MCTSVQMLVLTSCNKTGIQKSPASAGEKVKLTVSVAQPSSAVGSQATDQNTPLSSLVTQITYVFYLHHEGMEKERVTQLSTDPNFGQISLTLEKGEYYVIAIASKSEFGINQYYRRDDVPVLLNYAEAHMEYWQPNQGMGDKRHQTSDTFFANTRVVVDGTEPITMNLKRIVGKLEVQVDDVKDYWVNIRNEATGYIFNSGTSFGRVDDELLVVRSSDGPISVYIMQTKEPLSIVLAYGNALSQQRTMSVPIEKNKRTLIRGNILNPTTNGFTITVDDKWIPEPNIIEL